MMKIPMPKLFSNPFGKRQYGQMDKVTDSVYIFRNITNSSIVIGRDSVAVIDTQVNYPLAQRLIEEIKKVTDKPISHAINTHYHWDHTNGNIFFKKMGAEVIASELTKDFMINRRERQKEFLLGRGFEIAYDPLLPTTTFNNEMEIDLGDMPLRLFFAGRAESDDATAVHVPKENVVIAGDTVMTGSFPIFGQPVWDEGLEGTGQWLKTIETIQKLNPKHIIPGHGPLAYTPQVNALIKIQNYFIDEVRGLLQKGYELDAIISSMEANMPKWISKIPVVWGNPRYAILRIWRSLTMESGDPGWQRFKPSAIPESVVEIAHDKVVAEFVQMADELKEGGDIAGCLKVLDTACQRFDGDANILATYANTLIEASRAEDSVLEKGDYFIKAKKAWDQALTLEPNHFGSKLGKGRYWAMMAYRGGDDPTDGMALLQEVIEGCTQSDLTAEACFYKGMGHRRLGEEALAKDYFKKSLELNPAWKPAQLGLMA
ncbi:MAG: glyoxylase-like metal-dependent hydrolase (beta-lactamase superfamily II) [Candidatus Omnitrophota bacterium]|jgi:glyoxylase-like metal-dependent hydrolase (beta-lactamase superfamily II)